MSDKKCPNCGACKECGHGGRQQFVPMPYPYPIAPYRPPNWIPGTYPGTAPRHWYGPTYTSQPAMWGGTSQSSAAIH